MVIESPNRFQNLQSSDSDTESIPEAVTLFSSQSATLIQTAFRSYYQRSAYLSQQNPIPIVNMSTPTNYEFPGGFKVAVNLVSPVTNTDGLSAGRLYKKENRPTEGSKEEKELLTDIKTNRYSKYKVMNISLKDPEKLASNLSILDNLTYTQQFMLEYNMEDPFHICFPGDDPKSPATLTVDSSGKLITKDLFKDHRDITVEDVALSNRWYSRYAIFNQSGLGDRSFAKELEWSHLHFRSHVEQELYNVVYSEYITFSAEERGGPLFLKLLLLHLVVSDEANLEMLLDTVKNYKINENVDNEDMDKVIRLLKGVTGTIVTLRSEKTLPEKYIEHLCTALKTTSCPQFNAEIAGIEKDVTTSRRIQSANKSASMRLHSGSRTIAPTISGLILENNMQGVDFIFSLALETYRDLKSNGQWNASMRPIPGGAGAAASAGSFMAADQIVGPFCWNCESTEHAFPQCPKARDQTTIAKNRALYRKHKGDSDNGGRGDGAGGRGGDRWSKWKRPRPEENNKRIINNAPFTWNSSTRRWSKDETPPGPSGLNAGTPSIAPAQASGEGSGNVPFPPNSIGQGQDDVSQVSDSVSPSDLATLQLQLANLVNMVSKIGG
jgi:hypothetical protein